MNEVNRRRGRPVTYDHNRRAELAELIRRHGARGTQAVVPAPISIQTLLNIAREFDIPLKKGRRPSRAA